MQWIKCSEQKPPSYTDILVTDGNKCWVAQTFDNLNVYLASHPDYNREPKNEYGVPFMTYSKPIHWMPLPKPPNEIDEMLQKDYDNMVNSTWRPNPPEE